MAEALFAADGWGVVLRSSFLPHWFLFDFSKYENFNYRHDRIGFSIHECSRAVCWLAGWFQPGRGDNRVR